jgi:superfamily II DNA or RNA helicase
MELRPYQREAVEAIQQQWSDGRRRTLLVLPTGTGKTIVFCRVAEEVVRTGGRVLILAHRAELLDQAADKLQRSTGLACAIEKADQTSVGEWERITVGSVQTLMRQDRLDKFRPNHYQCVIVDEAHHALAETYQRILSHFCEANVLGVTATPDRGDLQNLGTYFDSLAYEYLLPQAVRDGYLCRIVAQTIPLQIELSGVKTQAGDFQLTGLGNALDPYLEQIADRMVEHRDRKLVVFLPLIATSRKFCQMLVERGLSACEVNGESPDRQEILQRFDAGGPSVLCNAMLLTEGWDCPSVDAICVLRPTKIRSLYCQMVGRGTRIHPGKADLLLLDFLWHSSTHSLCRPAHLVCESPEVAEAMTARLANCTEAIDLEEAQQEAESDVMHEREAALAKKLREQRKKKAKLVDPLQYAVSINAEDLVDYSPTFGWEMLPASDSQVKALEDAGIYGGEMECAGKASQLLDRLQQRRLSGLATPKQIRLLEGKGFLHVGQWSFEAARKMISRIALAGWRVPAGVVPEEYRGETI